MIGGLFRAGLAMVGLTPGALGLYALMFAAGVAFVVTVFVTGVNYEKRRGDVATANNARDAALRDLAAEKAARQRDQEFMDKIEADKKEAEERADALQSKISKLPPAEQCIAGPDIIEWLRDKSRDGAADRKPAKRPLFRPARPDR